MSRIQNGKNRNPEKPISGCLGRMVTNLFDLNTTIGGGNNKRLTDKPHHETTPIKTLIAQEMSKEDDCKQSPSNLVAKLMGLDALPPQHHHHQQPVSPPFRHHSRHSRSHSESHLELSHQSRHEITEECKDVYEIWQQHGNNNNNNYNNNNNKMALIREKFMEAKRLSTDEKLRQSKQFQDALEVLSSNKDLFLKFLQEPDSLFSQHLYNLQSLPPPPDSRRITVLRPSKLVDNQNQSQSQSQSQKKNKTSSDFIFSPESCKIDENPSQPTRIVILKPHSNNNIKVVDDSHDDVFDEVLESRKVDETTTLVSSVFSNGYVGDDSSFCKSEIENLSDSEAVSVSVSPTSRHSWDYINRFNSHYATSSSHASYSQESSVCREAKKRLSERWAIMASNKNVVEQKQIQRSSSTLGDMLALSDLKKTEEKESEIKEESRNDENTPGNLPRSRSVPASSGSFEDGDDERKEKLVKSSSFKGRVSSLFFSKNKKSSGKEKSTQSTDVRVPQSATTSSRNEGSLCLNDMIVEEESCSRLYRRSQGVILPEAGFSFKNNHSENQEQPSPISVLEPQFEEFDHTTNPYPNLGVDPMKYNLIGKSPPIGSISRTLSWDDSSTLKSSTPYTCKPSSSPSSSSAPLNPQQEEQECFFYIQTLLSVSGLNTIHTDSLFASWHSPESPLDPSLRDTYTNLTTEHSSSVLSQKRVYESLTRLVFDCVNEALVDIGAHTGAMMTSSVLVGECVWARVKEWLYSGEERWGWGEWEEGGGAVEEVVRKEVVGRGWVEGVRLESDDVRKEIEGKLLEEIVEEFVFELTNRAS